MDRLKYLEKKCEINKYNIQFRDFIIKDGNITYGYAFKRARKTNVCVRVSLFYFIRNTCVYIVISIQMKLEYYNA